MPEPADPYRLPSSVVPSAYRLRLEPDLAGARFEGTVQIDVEVLEATRHIVLNSLELELGAATLHGGGADRSATVSLDSEHQRADLDLGEEVAPGSYVVEIEFVGVLNDLLVGFYRSTYTDEDGTEHTIATTQFEATDARRAFPCFDEPALKATFDVTLVVPEGLEAYSNSPIAHVEPLPGGRRAVTFSRTMKMSTYLVAFVVGRFVATETVDAGGVPLRVVARPGKEPLTQFALDVGSFALQFFHEYFGLPYPGDKVDLIGIPDFAYGAMENLGCVTFREQELLIDPATASQNELFRVAEVIAHELAHMWFGDLVTMAWWEGIWLNEAFATFMQYVCVDAYKPEWKAWVRFSAEREAGLMVDGLHSTRPIEFAVRSPDDAAAMVDLITYQKGGSVLRMLEQYLGSTTFRDGIRHYLDAHAYANTVTADLWASLEAVSGQPVGEIMDTWILQGGHPTVSLKEGRLAQRPFSFGPPDGPSAIGSHWLVPVLLRPLHEDATTRQLLDEPTAVEVASPVLVNAGGSGVYRTSYEPAALREIAADLAALTEVERAVLLGDTWALVRAGEQRIAELLALASGLSTDVEPPTWDVVDELLDFLARTVTDEDRPLLAQRTRVLLGPAFAALGWSPRPGEDERASVQRATLLRRLGTTGEDEAVRAEAIARFESGHLDGDLADAIVSVVASLNRPGDYDEMVRRFKKAKDPQTEERYRLGLCAFADEATCLRTFRSARELFRSQDEPIAYARLVQNRVGGKAVWEAITESWDDLTARIPPIMQFALAVGLFAQVADTAFVERARAFHASHPLPASQQRIEQAIERLGCSVRLADRERPELAVTLR